MGVLIRVIATSNTKDLDCAQKLIKVKMSSDTEERKSSLIPAMLESIKIPVVQISPVKTSTNSNPKMDMEKNDNVEKEIKEIIANKDLKAKILEMVSQEWPFSCIKGQESWQTFLDIIRRDISTNLSEELSKIDTIEDDMTDLSKQKIENYMFDIVETLYNDEHLTDSKYSSEIMEPKNKVEYEVIMKRVKQDPNYNDDVDATTTVSLVGSDESIDLSDVMTQFSFPIESLLTDRLEIKLDQRNSIEKTIEKSTEKIRQKFQKFKLMTRRNTQENMEDNTTLEEIKISEFSFQKEVTKNLPDGYIWEIKLGVKFDKNGNQDFITFEQLKSFHFLTMAKQTKADVQALLNYLRPFFSPEDWNMSELNSKVKLLQKKKYSRDVEENILQKLMELDDSSKLDSNCLTSFKEFCLEEICAFEVTTHDTENEVISQPNDDVTIKRLHDIISALIHIFPEKNQYEKEFQLSMFRKLERNLLITSDMELCQKVEKQMLTTDYIVQKFGSFALTIWCPILYQRFLKIILLKVDELIDFSKDIENVSNLFKKLNTLSDIYCNHDFSEQLAETFEALLIKWAQDEKNLAEEHMTNLFYEEVKEKDAFDAKKSKEEHWKAFNQTIHIKRIFQKRHDDWNKKCDEHCVNEKEKMKYGKNLYEHLIGVLCGYATKLMELIMRDNNFDKVEFVMFLNTMHGSVHFLNTRKLFKIEDKRFFTLGDHDHTFQSMLQDIKRQFVEGQQLIFQQKILDGEKLFPLFEDEIDDGNLLGYLNGLCFYIKENLDLNCEGSEEDHIEHVYQEILEDLAAKLREAIQNCEKDKKEITKALEELKSLRNAFELDNVEENNKLEKDIEKSWLISAEEAGLISKFVSTTFCHDLDQQPIMGSLIFTAIKIPDSGKLEITLKSLKDIKPRRKDNLVDFSIRISLFPFETQKHCTKIYKNINESYLFDLPILDDSKEKDDTYKATFDFPKDKKEQFLQFILYDNSRTRTNKIFLGMFFIPIDDIVEEKSI